jgi:hypothetical protein
MDELGGSAWAVVKENEFLLKVFGRYPSFHDASVLSVSMERAKRMRRHDPADGPVDPRRSVLIRYDPLSDRYSVKGLYDLSDEREAHYIGSAEEIIMRNLHNSIFGVLHEAALCVSRIQSPTRLLFAELCARRQTRLSECERV